jgi:hypothetical protein
MRAEVSVSARELPLITLACGASVARGLPESSPDVAPLSARLITPAPGVHALCLP